MVEARPPLVKNKRKSRGRSRRSRRSRRKEEGELNRGEFRA